MICEAMLTEQELVDCGCVDDQNPTYVQQSLDAASELLHLLLAQRFGGICTTTYRPCKAQTAAGYLGGPGGQLGGWGYPTMPLLSGGVWFNIAGCGIGCDGTEYVLLPPHYPREIVEVRIDGTVRPAEEYRLWGRKLYRNSGLWPASQNLGLADTEPGTWSVTVEHGEAPTALVKLAAQTLTKEFLKACQGDTACRLPLRVQSVAKQGISIDFGTAQTLLTAGRTGILEVDQAIVAYNPGAWRSRPRIYSPEFPP